MFQLKQNDITNINFPKRILSFTYGHIAFAAFLIAAVSGIFLAIPFDIVKPFDSVSLILLTNPGGVLFRNVHYWSAQFFLIFTILHLFDHLKNSTERNLKSAVWTRLVISILVVFFVMLSGFILKADADSLQAKRIITSLLDKIPLFGKQLSYSFFGGDKNFQIIYVHHIATATIFLWIIIVEHSRFIWPKLKLVLYLTPLLILIGYLFPPVLNDGLVSVIKGPWYFLGLQEILHWLSYPLISIAIILIVLFAIYILPKLSESNSGLLKRAILASGIIYIVLTIIGFYFRGTDWQFNWPWENPVLTESKFEPFANIFTISDEALKEKDIPVILGRREGCMFCHENVKGFSPAHNPESIGCVSCHSGNPFTLEKTNAHRGMILVPGNIDQAKKTCGNSDCHEDISNRINNTLMTTLSGIVSVDKYVFNESKDLNKIYYIADINHSPAETHLRNLCASCHLGNEKKEPGPVTELSRGGGCNACHINYDKVSIKSLSDFNSANSLLEDTTKTFYHPSLSVKVSNDHCFGCHSRSGRISTNYEGWHETMLKPYQINNDSLKYKTLEDGRVFEKTQEDVHHLKGMDCIDCHTSRETMGDGKLHAHQEEQVQIACTDCHLTENPNTKSLAELDQESQKIIYLRNLDEKNRKYLIINNSGYPLVNTYLNNDNKPELITKNTKQKLPLKSPAFICTEGKGHTNLTCNSCHSSWSPQCIGCHTEYNADGKSYDLLSNKEVNGEWNETPKDFLADQPVLGIREIKQKNGRTKNLVDTFIPGMVLTINKGNINPDSKSDKDLIFKRLYAPSFSHTITKNARSCVSCHNSSLAIGYGRGKLNYKIENRKGKWDFIPEYKSIKYDNLPEDAWIGFLQERSFNSTTRTNTRPFNIKEQKEILTVGACLTCHNENSKPLKEFLQKGEMPKLSDKCILPVW